MLRPPAVLHRLALRVAHTVRLVWWRIRRPDLHGCNAIVADAGGAILLVRHSYQSPDHWMLPGGGLHRGESAETTAQREVLEETGCTVREPREFAIETVPLAGARNHIHLVCGRSDDTPVADGREIIAARFFSADALPDAILPAARRRIERWLALAHSSES